MTCGLTATTLDLFKTPFATQKTLSPLVFMNRWGFENESTQTDAPRTGQPLPRPKPRPPNIDPLPVIPSLHPLRCPDLLLFLCPIPSVIVKVLSIPVHVAATSHCRHLVFRIPFYLSEIEVHARARSFACVEKLGPPDDGDLVFDIVAMSVESASGGDRFGRWLFGDCVCSGWTGRLEEGEDCRQKWRRDHSECS